MRNHGHVQQHEFSSNNMILGYNTIQSRSGLHVVITQNTITWTLHVFRLLHSCGWGVHSSSMLQCITGWWVPNISN